MDYTEFYATVAFSTKMGFRIHGARVTGYMGLGLGSGL